MKRFIIFLIAVLMGQTAFAQGWEYQTPWPTPNSLADVAFVDNNNGWAAGGCGTILHTTNAGELWTPQASGTIRSLLSVFFSDANNGWAAGDAGTILRTTNGGSLWTAQNSGSEANLRGVDFLDANHGWIVGDGGTIVQTTDGGDTWAAQVSGTGYNLAAVDFVDLNHGWAVGGDGGSPGMIVIRHTTDGGATWTPQISGATEYLSDIVFVNANTGWAVGGSAGTIVHTTDGGALWTEQISRSGPGFYDVVFLDSSRGWAAGDQGRIVRTTDGGQTWTERNSGTTASLTGLTMTDALHGGAVGGDPGSIVHTTDGGETWTLQTRAMAIPAFNDLSFVDPSNGWAVADAGTIMRTFDGGNTWTAQASGTTQNLKGLACLYEDLGWAVGDSGVIVHTEDGGVTWMPQTSGITTRLNAVAFADPNNGWAVGGLFQGGGSLDEGSLVIIHTTDGGATWTTQMSGQMLMPLYDVFFLDASHGWAVGGYVDFEYAGNIILRTTDGGSTWAVQLTNDGMMGPGPISSVVFWDENSGWATSRWGLMHTTDGGWNWAAQSLGDSSGYCWVSDISVAGENNLWGVGARSNYDGYSISLIVHSTDGGETWALEPSVIFLGTLNRVTFFDADHGWAMGNSWYSPVLVHMTTGENGVSPRAKEVPRRITLYQNYPNPFNATTIIAYDLPHASRVSLRVFDLLGREVIVLNDGMVEAGTHRVTFDGSDLSSGIYFAQLRTGKFVQTGKMVLVR
jgi:photosystem II stability/assembly factor-like uncharacterized protein